MTNPALERALETFRALAASYRTGADLYEGDRSVDYICQAESTERTIMSLEALLRREE